MENSKGGHHGAIWSWTHLNKTYDIYYEEFGDGPKHIIFLHGFAFHSHTWRFLTGELAKAGFHVWALDFIGHGKSDKPLDVSYNTGFFSDQVVSFIQNKKISDCVLIGNSLGGGAAIDVAYLIPKDIKALVLIDAFIFDFPFPFTLQIAKFFGPLVKPFIGKQSTKSLIKSIFFDKNLITEDLIMAYTRPLHTKNGRDAIIKMLREDAAEELKLVQERSRQVKKPTLIIWGANDPWMDNSYYNRVVELFPDAQKHVILNCGHVPQEEQPKETLAAIFEFLKQWEKI